MKFKGMLIGLEDVICSTGQFYAQACKLTLGQNGIDSVCFNDQDLFVFDHFDSFRQILKQNEAGLSPSEFEMIVNEADNLYRQLLANMDKRSLLPGVEQLLKALRRYGYKICLVSGNSHAILILRHLRILHIFDAICDGYDLLQAKTAMELYSHACAMLDLQKNDVIIWENNVFQQAAAKREGFRLICGNALHVVQNLLPQMRDA